jgi:hypothetical protein
VINQNAILAKAVMLGFAAEISAATSEALVIKAQKDLRLVAEIRPVRLNASKEIRPTIRIGAARELYSVSLTNHVRTDKEFLSAATVETSA